MRYIPHTEGDITRMLRVVGRPSVAALFDHIPERLRAKRAIAIEPLDEAALLGHLGDLAMKNQPATGATARDGAALSFLGAGLIPHHVPTAVDAMLTRAEWYTSYTPYQPEISQGTLQAVFEYQTIVSELLGLEVANASMYDGASGVAEGALMARRVTGRHRILVAGTLHPHTLGTIETYLLSGEAPGAPSPIDVVPHGKDGRVDLAALEARLGDDVAGVIVQTPNFFGVVEDLGPLAAKVHAHGALLVAANCEPVAFGAITPPGAQGADIAACEGIGLATPPMLGGPGVGLFAARADLVRNMPGRLVGETVDQDGRRGYVLTLATREQHIRREKATSNICTNQGLIALAFTIHLCLLGRRGLAELAALNLAKAEYARKRLIDLAGFGMHVSGPTFNELALSVRGGDAAAVAAKLAERGIFAGVPASAPGLMRPRTGADGVLLVAVTERHSKADIDRLAHALDEVTK